MTKSGAAAPDAQIVQEVDVAEAIEEVEEGWAKTGDLVKFGGEAVEDRRLGGKDASHIGHGEGFSGPEEGKDRAGIEAHGGFDVVAE